jgi:hypothetical protein
MRAKESRGREAIGRSLMLIQSRMYLRVISLVIALFVFGVVISAGLKTNGQDSSQTSREVATEQWEYLALAGPMTGLTPVDNPRLRKEPTAAFNREAFALEQQLDKLGANGWELVAITGSPTDPAYYFKRRKK